MIGQTDARDLARRALLDNGLPPDCHPVFPGKSPSQAQLFRAAHLLVKVYSPEARDRALKQALRQGALAEEMCDGPFRVPPVVFADTNCVIAMPWIEGTDLASAHRENRPVADKAGLWLKAFHAPTLRRFPFRPAGHVNWLDRLIEQGETGQRSIPDLPGFVQAARKTQSLAEDARRQKATRAVTHRDMTLGNLMDDGKIVWGIDFENDREDEPLRDVFTLALDLATASTDAGPAIECLAERYGDGHTAPPVRLFLQRCFCLWVWANTPQTPSLRQARRLAVALDWLSRDEILI